MEKPWQRLEKDIFAPDPHYFRIFPVLMPLVLIGILFNAIVGSIPAVFMQKVIAVVEQNWQSGDWNGCKDEILRYTGILLTLYGLALAASIFYNRKWLRSPKEL